MEYSADHNHFSGRPLFKSTDQLLEDEDHFSTPSVSFGDLGKVKLDGDRGFEFGRNDKGIAVIGNKILEQNSIDLDKKGLYEVIVTIKGVKGNNPLVCRVFDPKTNAIFQSEMGFDIDEVDSDSETRFSASTNKWRKEGEGEDKNFFIPKDPDLISRFQFSFSTSTDIPQ